MKKPQTGFGNNRVEYNLRSLSIKYNNSTSRHCMFAHEYATGITTDHWLSRHNNQQWYIKYIEHINSSATSELQTPGEHNPSQNWTEALGQCVRHLSNLHPSDVADLFSVCSRSPHPITRGCNRMQFLLIPQMDSRVHRQRRGVLLMSKHTVWFFSCCYVFPFFVLDIAASSPGLH